MNKNIWKSNLITDHCEFDISRAQVDLSSIDRVVLGRDIAHVDILIRVTEMDVSHFIKVNRISRLSGDGKSFICIVVAI